MQTIQFHNLDAYLLEIREETPDVVRCEVVDQPENEAAVTVWLRSGFRKGDEMRRYDRCCGKQQKNKQREPVQTAQQELSRIKATCDELEVPFRPGMYQ